MRSSFYKCTNHIRCLTGYHGDDVEIEADAARVCPECGSPLRPLRKGRRGIPAWLVNGITIAVFAFAIWLAWPGIQRAWKKFTAPAGKIGR
jgi:DNA-directed RNA polymerase subunit RPC12/RpoP